MFYLYGIKGNHFSNWKRLVPICLRSNQRCLLLVVQHV